MSLKKHGNDQFWCFLDDGRGTNRTIEIWQSIGADQEEIMAYGNDRYNAMQIVDALILADKVNDNADNKLNKHEMMFLQFVESNCQEPFSTMAGNAILWSDREVYNNLKSKFKEIY
jgi:hypothetical protein